MLPKFHAILLCLTRYDLLEIACCIGITHSALHLIYKKQGAQWYTISYFYALGIIISWLCSYKIISAMLLLGGAIIKTMFSLPTQHIPAALLPTQNTPEKSSWIENMIALSIQGFHEDISLTWIIDYAEQLHDTLYAEISLHVYTVPKLSHIVFNTIDPHTRTTMLWVNRQGYIIGINPQKGSTSIIPSSLDMVLWSKNKGAIILQSYAQKRSYSVVHNGTLKDNLSSHHAYHLMKQILLPQQTTHLQESL